MLNEVIEAIDAKYNLKKTLHEISVDTSNKQYMTDSDEMAYDFDKIKYEYIKDLSAPEIPHSNDALLQVGDELFFIEFKNGGIDQKENYELRLKIYESFLIFLAIVNKTIDDSRCFVNYILVYNEKENHTSSFYKTKSSEVKPSASRDALMKATARKAGEETVNFDLLRYKSMYFKSVHTYTKAEFKKNFIEGQLKR